MGKGKQIEEIALIVSGIGYYTTKEADIAKKIYAAGYRKIGKTDTNRAMLNIQNLLQEFDEMGYEPTTLCESPDKTARQWKENLLCEICSLLDEYTAIREKAVKDFAHKLKSKAVQEAECEDYVCYLVDYLLKEYER